MKRILITADLHFERIEKELIPCLLSYIEDTIKTYRPNIFCIAGDTTDDANLRAETEEFINLVSFVENISKICREYNTCFIVLRGTPSHDGRIMENIHKMLDTFIYVDKMTNMEIQGISLLLVPELYYPKYELFLEDLNKHTKSDVVIFHGMMDFAIPALNQVDSKFNMGRSIVVSEYDFINKAKYLVVGGHVHSSISNKNVYYTNRIINERGHDHNKDYGLKLIDLHSNDYEYRTIENPYLIKHEYINLDFTKNTLDVLIANSIRPSYDNVIFNVILNNEDQTKNKYNTWKQSINAKYIKKTNVRVEKEYVINKTVLQTQDAVHLLKDIYTKTYNKSIPEDILKRILEGDNE